MQKPSSHTIITRRWKRDVVTFGLLRDPIVDSSHVPCTPPNPTLVRLFLKTQSDGVSDITSLVVMRILEAFLISLASSGTLLQRR